jgi:hypothetical protein
LEFDAWNLGFQKFSEWLQIMMDAQTKQSDLSRGYQAVEVLYHAYLTGLILTVMTRRNRDDAAALVFRTFRSQHNENFLSGLDKLGLKGLPDPVAAAQYHYLSNYMAGVNVQYMYESDRKAWVRYTPPRWIYEGTAICAVPGEVSRAMMRGWHAYNGVTLGNPRLGFVCTKQTMDGQPGLEGYFCEYDHDLSPDERLRFAPGEGGPAFDPTKAPQIDDADWPPERLLKVRRNYVMGYVRVMILEMMNLFGPAEGRHLAGVTGRLIGMQYFSETAGLLGISETGPEAFAEYLVRLGQAQGDRIEWETRSDAVYIRQITWRLMQGIKDLPLACFDAWNDLWIGAASVLNSNLFLEVCRRMEVGDECFEWRVRMKPPSRLE